MLAVEMPGKRSTVHRPKPPGKVNRRRTVDRVFAALDRRRAELGISREKLVSAAAINLRTYHRLQSGRTGKIREATRLALAEALDRIPRPAAGDQLAALHRSAMALFAREFGLEPDLVIDTDFSKQTSVNETWLAAARVRRLAMSVLAVEFDVGKARLARAIGCTKQNVGQAVSQISDLRDEDPKIEAAIGRVAKLLGRRA